MTLQEILSDIHSLEEDLLAFERKYGIRSEIFYAAYISGEEPEDDNWVLDFGEWASVYRTWLDRQAEYRNEKLYWYDSQSHPSDPALQSTDPHHKHIPPDLKHHRTSAPQMSFTQPNLPTLIREIETLTHKGR